MNLQKGPWTYYVDGNGNTYGIRTLTGHWDVRYDRPTDTMYIGLETSLYENLNSLLEMFRFRFGQAKWDDRNLVWNKWNDMGRFLLTDSSQVGSLAMVFQNTSGGD